MKNEVSFIIIAYNEEKIIARCIDSILTQNEVANVSILVVDDGSKDNTAKIVASYTKNDARVKLHQLSKNEGRGAARAAGIKVATGTYLAFIDADIVLPANWLQVCLSYMDRFDAVGGIAVPDGDVNYVYVRFNLDPKNVKHTTVVSGCNGLYKKKIFETITFDSSLREGEDVALNHLMIENGLQTHSIQDLVVDHKEAKSYIKSLCWLYQSGIGAARQFKRYRKIRLPDMAFVGFLLITSGSVAIANYVHNYFLLLSVPIYICITSALLLLTRFHVHLKEGVKFIFAIFVNSTFIAMYYIGRIIGIFTTKITHAIKQKNVLVLFDLEGAMGMHRDTNYDLSGSITGILEVLKKNNVHAVFFVVGKIIEEYPELIKKIHSHGHQIGVHGYEHEHLERLTKEELEVFKVNLLETVNHVEHLTGSRPVAFRSPYLMAPKFFTPELYTILERCGFQWVSNREFRYTEEFFRDRIKIKFLWGKNTWYTKFIYFLLNLNVIQSENLGTSKRGLWKYIANIKWMMSGAEPFYRGNLLEVPVYSPLDGDLLGFSHIENQTPATLITYTINCLSQGIQRHGSYYSLNFHDWVIGTSNRIIVIDEVLKQLSHNSHVHFLLSPVIMEEL